MSREDRVERRAEPHQPPARMAVGDGETERAVEIGDRGVFAHEDIPFGLDWSTLRSFFFSRKKNGPSTGAG